jgi:hypothetical protein
LIYVYREREKERERERGAVHRRVPLFVNLRVPRCGVSVLSIDVCVHLCVFACVSVCGYACYVFFHVSVCVCMHACEKFKRGKHPKSGHSQTVCFHVDACVSCL